LGIIAGLALAISNVARRPTPDAHCPPSELPLGTRGWFGLSKIKPNHISKTLRRHLHTQHRQIRVQTKFFRVTVVTSLRLHHLPRLVMPHRAIWPGRRDNSHPACRQPAVPSYM
jgi:hypothetical protein